MEPMGFEEAVERIRRIEPRYAADAYRFVRDALDDSARIFDKPARGPGRHVRGQELLEAFRRRALAEFGPMAACVMRAWGIGRTEDVGDIVFHLVDAGVLGKTPEDCREDFQNGFPFEEAFLAPFRPAGNAARSGPASGQRPEPEETPDE